MIFEFGYCDIKMFKLCEGFFCNVSFNKVFIIKKDKFIDSLLNFICYVESVFVVIWVNDDKENFLNFIFMYWDLDFIFFVVFYFRDDLLKFLLNVLCFELGFKFVFV